MKRNSRRSNAILSQGILRRQLAGQILEVNFTTGFCDKSEPVLLSITNNSPSPNANVASNLKTYLYPLPISTVLAKSSTLAPRIADDANWAAHLGTYLVLKYLHICSKIICKVGRLWVNIFRMQTVRNCHYVAAPRFQCKHWQSSSNIWFRNKRDNFARAEERKHA